jgi:hypothetical protein
MDETTLRDLLAARAGSLEGALLSSSENATEVVVGEVVVAVMHPASLEVRLRPAVADAALKTPDVAPSGRGRGWVRFAPSELDDFARDRAAAWLESAVRLAVEDAERA